MFFPWLLAAIPTPAALPSATSIKANLSAFNCNFSPSCRQQRSYDAHIKEMHAVVMEEVEAYARKNWAATATIFDGHSYGSRPIPVIPGLLVAQPIKAVHWSDSALIFDGYSYGSLPVPVLPGLLVAPSPVPAPATITVPINVTSTATYNNVVASVVAVLVAVFAFAALYYYAFKSKDRVGEKENKFGKGFSEITFTIPSAVHFMASIDRHLSSIWPSKHSESHYDAQAGIIQVLDTAIRSREATIHELEATIHELTVAAASAKAEHERHLQERDDQLHATKVACEHLYENAANHRRYAREAVNKLQTMKKGREPIKQQLVSVQHGFAAIGKRLSSAERKRSFTQKQSSSKKMTLHSTLVALAAAQEEKEEAYARITVLEGEKKDLEATVICTQKQLESSETAKTEITTQYEDEKRNFATTVHGLSASLQFATASNKELSTSYHTLSASYQTLSASYQALSASQKILSASTQSIGASVQEQTEIVKVIGGVVLEVAENVTVLQSSVEHVDQVSTDFASTVVTLRDAYTARISSLEADKVTLTQKAAIANQNDMDSWAIVAGLRVDLGETEAKLEIAESELAVLLTKGQLASSPSPSPIVPSVTETTMSEEDIWQDTICSPVIEDAVAFLASEVASSSSTVEDTTAPLVCISESASTASFMALATSSSDNLLALDLPADTSFTSVDGFGPLVDASAIMSPIEETNWYDDDPFMSDPMLAIPMIRLTASAPSSPPYKFAAARRIDWSRLHASASDPSGLSSY